MTITNVIRLSGYIFQLSFFLLAGESIWCFMQYESKFLTIISYSKFIKKTPTKQTDFLTEKPETNSIFRILKLIKITKQRTLLRG